MMRYNIHDIITFEVIDKRKYAAKKIDTFYNQFKYYREFSNSKNTDFIINISNFDPQNEECQILDGKYYVKDNYIYCKDEKKLSKWRIELSNWDKSPTTINISTNIFGNISVLTNFTDFLIHLKMAEKGYPLIHSSGVLIDNRGIAFAARSSGGKTTIATNLMERGFKYFGDNFIVLNSSQIYNFLSPLNLYTYNLTPLIRKNLTFRKKTSIFAKQALYIVSRRYLKLSTKLNLFEILPDQVINQGKLDILFLIIPKTNFSINKLDKKELIKHLVYNQQIEFMHMPFLNYIYAYSYVFPDSTIGNHWKIYENSLRDAIGDKVKIYKIEVPLKYNSSIIEEIFKFVTSN